MILITLMTDFGHNSPYVGQLKGRLLSLCPSAQIVDLTHDVPPLDLRAGALMLADFHPWLPHGTVHCAVVDPGVGTQRRVLAADIAGGRYIVPDNGLITELARRGHVQQVVSVDLERFRATASATFHGRDIIAPVAAEVAQGTHLNELGPDVDDWVRLEGLLAKSDERGCHGHVWLIDRFGNLITTIRREQLRGEAVHVHIAGRTIAGLQTTYGDRPAGELVSLIGSSNYLEIAVVGGNAAALLRASVGNPVTAVALSAP